jgi:hypothetical protein
MFKDANIQVPKTIMPQIVEFSAGVPFYAVALCEVLLKKMPSNSIVNEEDLNEAISIVFSPGGRIYEHFDEWIIKACERINQSELTTPILKSLAKRYPHPKISVKTLIEYIHEDFGLLLKKKEVLATVRKLNECDILRDGPFLPDTTLAKWLEVVEFPIEFDQDADINKGLLHELIALKQKLGTFFEVVLACLFMAFDGKTSVPGDWVGWESDVVFPKLKNVNREYLIAVPMGSATEADVTAYAGKVKWLAESKFWDKKVSVSDIKKVLKTKEFLEKWKKEKVQIFYFAKNGFSKEARRLLKENNAYIVTKDGMNKLLETFGLDRYKL